jgi:hypothetical protein
MSNLRARIVSRGVDWVTVTAKPESLQRGLWNIGEQLLSDKSDGEREDIKAVEMRGYRGYTAGGLFLGKRDDTVMLRGSSEDAQGVYDAIYTGKERYTVTRLDLQVTGKFSRDNEGYARRAERESIKAMAVKASKGRSNIGSIRGNGRGDTGTFGSRSSQRYLRCYDKTREQRGEIESNLWRWEVEYKGELGQRVSDILALHKEQAPAIVGTVASEFLRKGVRVPWRGDKGIEVPTTGVGSTDDGRRLKWLNMQVAPVISLLIEHVGLNAVLVALGLAQLIPPEGK